MALIEGGVLDDTLTGSGSDSLVGYGGNDFYFVLAGDLILEQPAEGRDTVLFYGPAYTLPDHTEILRVGDTTGAAGTGNAGDNILSGNNGADTLDGAAGADIMAGGSGNDLYVIDHDGDQVLELGNSGNDTIQSGVDYDLMRSWHIENLTLTGSAVVGLGNWLDNVITGNAGANRLAGNRGNDTIVAGAGDSVDGGLGVDVLVAAGSGLALDLANVAGIERIDLTGSGDNALTVTLADVLRIPGLTIDGNAGDSVLLAPGWADAGVSGGYHQYTQGMASLLVDTDLAVTL